MTLEWIYSNIIRPVVRLLPVGFKRRLKSSLKSRHSDTPLLKKANEDIIPNKTLYPGMGEYVLPYTYKYFESYYSRCELNSKRWVFDNLQDSGIVLDVGANIGVYSVLFGAIAKKGQVYSIEATDTINLLQQNLKHYGLDNVKTYKLGLFDKTGLFPESIYKMWGKPPITSTYSFSTLDDFVATLELNRLDLIKIDTDGFEIEILKGAAKTLEHFNPWLMIEFSYALNTRGHEVGHLIEKLIELGYKRALLLDGNNLILKKGSQILEDWSNSLQITPHEYSLSKLFDVSEKPFPDTLNGLIRIFDADKFFKEVFFENCSVNDEIFPCLPNRGPRMEVNDAPVLAKIYQIMNSRNHLEFGTWEGFGTALFCSNSSGYVTTINLPEGELSLFDDQSPSYSSSLYPSRRKQFTSLDDSEQSDSHLSIGWIYREMGFESRVRQILQNSLELSARDFPQKFETILIDGAHDCETVTHDTRLALQTISDDGVIIWHDFLPFQQDREKYPSTFGVYEAINTCIEELQSAKITLYWIENTWLLIGKRSR